MFMIISTPISRMVRSIDIADALFDESNQGEPGIVLVETKEDGDLANFETLAGVGCPNDTYTR